jgi:hypothetical protein
MWAMKGLAVIWCTTTVHIVDLLWSNTQWYQSLRFQTFSGWYPSCFSLKAMAQKSFALYYIPFSYTPFSYTPFSYTPFSYTPFSYTPFSYTPFSYTPFSYTPFSYTPFSYTPFSYTPFSFPIPSSLFPFLLNFLNSPPFFHFSSISFSFSFPFLCVALRFKVHVGSRYFVPGWLLTPHVHYLYRNCNEIRRLDNLRVQKSS